jgi:hypothetical protein
MKLLRLLVVSGAASAVVCSSALAAPQVVTVDVAGPVKPADHAASGSLYGLAEPGKPPDALIAPLKPKNFTQMAPAAGSFPMARPSPPAMR